jgi:hypothetical protein
MSRTTSLEMWKGGRRGYVNGGDIEVGYKSGIFVKIIGGNFFALPRVSGKIYISVNFVAPLKESTREIFN